MNRKPIYLACTLVGLFLVLSSCSFPGSNSTPAPADMAPVDTDTAPDTSDTADTSDTPDTPEAILPTATSTPQGISPGNLPEKRADHASDVDSSPFAQKKAVPGGDQFVRGLYERPLNADTMDTYFPYIDIVDTQGFKDDTWGYASITLAGTDPNGNLLAKYGVELDINKDGRGDLLILASRPSSNDWTTQGVQAWQDTNANVDNRTPLHADTPPGGDGYETLVFDQGQGDVPDSAWVRISPDDPNTVELAFKLSMLGNPDSFAMGSWAGTDDLEPSMFDLNDHLTHEQAGSPLPDYFVYPLKELSEIDNTCRMAIGFSAAAEPVPGLCVTIVPHEPGQPTQAPQAPPVPGRPQIN